MAAQRRARSAAPISPARLPSRALRISSAGRCPRPVSWAANAARTGASSRSPASLTPPPMTTTAGSRTAVSEAIPSPSQRPSGGQQLDGERVAGPGRLGDQRAGDLVGVAAGAVEQRPGEQRPAAGRGPGLADQGAAAGVLLEAAAVAAAAQQPVGHDAHVADLGRHAERAAEQLAVVDDAAADAGADGDQQQVVDVVAGAEA